MSVVVIVIGLLLSAIGLLGLASPERLIRFVKSAQTPAGLYMAASLRILLGVALWFAAPASRSPDALRMLGILVFTIGIITPVLGIDRFRSLLEWWESRGAIFIRVWACFASAFGLLLVYSVAI